MKTSKSKFLRYRSLSLCLIICWLISAATGPSVIPAQAVSPLTEADIAGWSVDNLASVAGVPVLPLYSIAASVNVINVHANAAIPAPSASKRIGIQIGHLDPQDLPNELASLRGVSGASAGGLNELDVNQNVARILKVELTQKGYQVDILPSTVPAGYHADVFLALHNDVSPRPATTGFKIARSRYSLIPATDDRLLDTLYTNYAAATGLPHEAGITINMTAYYIFNNHSFQTSLDGMTPAALIEMGFLTNASDRIILTTGYNKMATGLVNGLTAFLTATTSPVTPATHLPVLQVKGKADQLVPVSDGNGKVVAYLTAGQQLAYYQLKGDAYSIWLPVLNRFGQLASDQAEEV